MRAGILIFLVALSIASFGQERMTDLPSAPQPQSQLAFVAALSQAAHPPTAVASPQAAASQAAPLTDLGIPTTLITRSDAERIALQNNPRITASHLLALAAGQVTRQTRSGELPQVYGAVTAEKAEDASRMGPVRLQFRACTHTQEPAEHSVS